MGSGDGWVLIFWNEAGEPVDRDVFSKPLGFEKTKSADISLPLQLPLSDHRPALSAARKLPLNGFSQRGEAERMMEGDEHIAPGDARGFAQHGAAKIRLTDVMQQPPDDHAVHRLVRKRQPPDIGVHEAERLARLRHRSSLANHRQGNIAADVTQTPLGQLLLHARGRVLTLAGNIRINSWQGRETADFFIEDAMPEKL